MPKKQRIYDYFSEFASEALHIVIFENFVKSMMSCLSKLKVTPNFCFAFKIPDDVTASNKYCHKSTCFCSFFGRIWIHQKDICEVLCLTEVLKPHVWGKSRYILLFSVFFLAVNEILFYLILILLWRSKRKRSSLKNPCNLKLMIYSM